MDPATVMQAIQSWPMEVQVDFACRLWEQVVESGWQPEVTDDLKAELDRRLARLRSGQAVEIPAEQVFAKWRRNQYLDG